MTGSTPFSIEASDNFKRSFKKLAKVHRDSFVALIGKTLEEMKNLVVFASPIS